MRMRADLSGPVLAIIITVAIIAAGLGLAAYFWWLAPAAGKAPTLEIIGEPALMYNSSENSATLYMSVKNVGNEDINIESVVLAGDEAENVTKTIPAGGKVEITASFSSLVLDAGTTVVEGVLVTDGGVYPFSAYVITTS